MVRLLSLANFANSGNTGWKQLPGVRRFDAADAANLRFCPIVSVDVEHTFSVFKHIFADKRQWFSEENLEKSVYDVGNLKKHCLDRPF